MYEYNIYPENSSKKFIEVCETIGNRLKQAQKGKMLVDIDGSTIQEFLLKDKSVIVYDDYDIGAVFVKSDIELEFLD